MTIEFIYHFLLKVTKSQKHIALPLYLPKTNEIILPYIEALAELRKDFVRSLEENKKIFY